MVTSLIGLIIGEVFVRRVHPQMTFSKANAYSMDCFVKSPLLPFELKQNDTCSVVNYYGDFSTTARLNNLGMRGADFDAKKTPATKRILILGDSMTFGVGVRDDQIFSVKTQEKLVLSGKPVQVVNAGYADGFSPDSYYVYLKNKGLDLDPDVVVATLFVWNDISDFSETVWTQTDAQGLPEAVDSCCRMIDDRVLRDKTVALKFKYPIFRESHAFLLTMDTLAKRFGWFGQPKDEVPKRDLEQGCILTPTCISTFASEEEKFKKVMLAMKVLVAERQKRFVVLILPVDVQLDQANWRKYGRTWLPDVGQEDFIQKRIGQFLAASGIEYVDAYPDFAKYENVNSLFFPDDAHLTASGHELVGSILSNFFLEEKP